MHHTIIVKASYAKHGNVPPKDVAAEASLHGIISDGGGMVIGQRSRVPMYEHWFVAGSTADADLFRREVQKLGYDVILLDP